MNFLKRIFTKRASSRAATVNLSTTAGTGGSGGGGSGVNARPSNGIVRMIRTINPGRWTTLACAYMIGAALLGQHASQGRMTPKDRETDNLENREQMRIW